MPGQWVFKPALVAVLLAAGSPAPASASPQLDGLLARIQSAGQRTRTLQASFVQRKRVPMFKSEVVSQGRLTFVRPDKLRWETFPPDQAVLVVKGEHAELRLPGEKPRLLDLKAGSALGSLVEQMLVWFGMRPPSALQGHYQVSLRGSAAEPQLHVVPRDPALRKRVASIELWLGRQLEPKRLQLDGGDGDLTLIEFGPVRRNQTVPDTLFR